MGRGVDDGVGGCFEDEGRGAEAGVVESLCHVADEFGAVLDAADGHDAGDDGSEKGVGLLASGPGDVWRDGAYPHELVVAVGVAEENVKGEGYCLCHGGVVGVASVVAAVAAVVVVVVKIVIISVVVINVYIALVIVVLVTGVVVAAAAAAVAG